MAQDASGEAVMEDSAAKALRSQFIPPKGQNGGSGRLSTPMGNSPCRGPGAPRGLTADMGELASRRIGKPFKI